MKMRRRGFTLIEAGVVGAVLIAGGAVAQVSVLRPKSGLTNSFAKLQAHSTAVSQYRADNAGAFPITLTYRRGGSPGSGSGGLVGWCSWSHAGKNNDGWWAGSGFGFDVEAADRPLNTYLYPGMVFQAPPPPAQMTATDPARAQQAPLSRDDSDTSSQQRLWPQQSKVPSTYIDVGSSYHWQSSWLWQVTGGFESSFHQGTSKLRSGVGVTPSRFVWEDDPFEAIVVSSTTPALQQRNWWGDINKSIMLFVDGHAGYHPTYAGRRLISFSNPDYSLIFDDLPNPGRP